MRSPHTRSSHSCLSSNSCQRCLRSFYEFTDFAHFIDVYIAVNSLVRTPQDIVWLIEGIAADLRSQQVGYAELTITPASARTAGRSAARGEHGVELGLESGERTIDWVERQAPVGSVGSGLGGPEEGVGRPQFTDVFARARALGLKCLPHAGETTGPPTVWDAIGRLADHPFPALRDAGIPVTLNSDDPGMFSTTLNHEYVAAHVAWGLDEAGLADLARASVRVSYAAEDLKREILREIDELGV